MAHLSIQRMDLNMKTVFLNDTYIKPEQAKVSVYDRGFLFGEGIYEVIAAHKNTLIDLDLHMQRLKSSLQAMKIPFPKVNFEHIFKNLLKKNIFKSEQVIFYIQITRGGSHPRTHAYQQSDRVNVFCDINPIQLPHYSKFERFKIITLPDYRWAQCYIKSTNLIANTMAYNQALNEGAIEAVLHREGKIVEGSKSNVFIVKNNAVITPPLRQYMLGGTLRKRTLELLHQLKIPHHEATVSREQLLTADEVWITSTTRLINPITQVDDHILTRENFGPIWQRMNEALQKDIYQQLEEYA